jgi:predicted nucleic acid-binding protein
MSLRTASWLEKKLSRKRVLIDTNIIIYLTDAVPPYADLARGVFRNLEAGRFSAVFSLVSVAEIICGPLRNGLGEAAFRARDYLLNFPNATCPPVDEGVISAVGVDTRVKWARLRAADALIIATGLVHGVDCFLSNDLRWRGALAEELLLTFDAPG